MAKTASSHDGTCPRDLWLGLVAGTCGWDLWLGLVAGTSPLVYADLYRNSNHHLVAKRLDIAIISSVLN